MKKSIDLNRDWNQWFKSHWFKSAKPDCGTLTSNGVGALDVLLLWECFQWSHQQNTALTWCPPPCWWLGSASEPWETIRAGLMLSASRLATSIYHCNDTTSNR